MERVLPPSRPRRATRRIGLAAGALLLGLVGTPEGALSSGSIWVDGYAEPADGKAETTNNLSLLTYNIKNGKIDREGVKETIHAMQGDIIALNETSPALTQELAAGGYQYRFGRTLREENGSAYGNAVLINPAFEVLQMNNIPLPSEGHEPRAVLHVEVDTGNGTPLNVFVTHFTAGNWRDSNSDVRLDQAKALVDVVEALGPQNALVLGDFNEEDGPAYDYISLRLSNGLYQGGYSTMPTFSNGYEQSQFDHIFLSPDTFATDGVRRSGSGASDHEALGITINTQH